MAKQQSTLAPGQRQYSQSLRAPLYRSHNKLVVFVPGFYETFLNPTSGKVVEGADWLDEEVENLSSSSSAMKSPIMEMDTHDEVINSNVMTPNPDEENLAGSFSNSKMSTPTAASFLSRSESPPISTPNAMIIGATQPDLPLEPNPEENPKNSGAYTDEDPFLVKLQ